MKQLAKLILVFLATVPAAVGAQSPSGSAWPEAELLIRRAILQQRLAESKERDYVFRQEYHSNKLRKECTWAPECPGIPTPRDPAPIGYKVLKYTTRKFEIFWLDGIRVARVLPDCTAYCNTPIPGEQWIRNIPISDSELGLLNQRVDAEVAEAKALLAQGKNPNSPGIPPQILVSRLLELCSFSNPRRQIVNERPTILLDFVWDPSTKPLSANETMLKYFSGTLGIDEEEQAIAHVQGTFLTDVNLGDGNIKIRKGTRVIITNRRVDTGIWLLSEFRARGKARYFGFAIDGDGFIFAGNYRKFQVNTKILPGAVQVSPRLPLPPH